MSPTARLVCPGERQPTSIAPDRSPERGRQEISALKEHGVDVRCSWARLYRPGAVTRTSLLHYTHPLPGPFVCDTASGRTGVLQAVAPDCDTPQPVAWLRPEGGGTEWTISLRAVDPVTAPDPPPVDPSRFGP
ncbi:hypothetical protein [Streptomyces flaveolus]|uniref:hypothetical protein n=1 Tax=Streptomyces flaveolus TaxID=67297 RepID=UPI0036F984D3